MNGRVELQGRTEGWLEENPPLAGDTWWELGPEGQNRDLFPHLPSDPEVGPSEPWPTHWEDRTRVMPTCCQVLGGTQGRLCGW